ncbi:hypothetical protein [Roseibium sp. TrichSKD4]|uniref:hypothetical protein n=1 Tax=Roseibium sp. TrichSKD4 TaxID=744980 RepID=UPI00058D1A9C|nr:hypothetical protein [Roseibium sp. TrichSKD4]
MTEFPDLKPDCSSCAALCCVVFAFDQSESFAIDKEAGEVCPNLSKSGQCNVFDQRSELGFKGCITYTCHGAGQRVTQELFQGRSWRDDEALTHRMGEALSVLRRVHEHLAILDAASSLPLSDDHLLGLSHLTSELLPADGWSEESLAAFPIDEMVSRVSTFLKSLRSYV